MSIGRFSILAGALYGDEGKEATLVDLSMDDRIDAAVRSQGPQHGGQVWYNGKKSIRNYIDSAKDEGKYRYEHDAEKGELHIFRQIPGTIYTPNTELFLAAGAIIDPEVVERETRLYTDWGVKNKLKIDPESIGILPRHKEAEQKDNLLKDTVKSVLTGYRRALSDSVMGLPDVLAKNVEGLIEYTEGGRVDEILNNYLNDGKHVMAMCVQSTHLSRYYGEWPNRNGYDNTIPTIQGQIGIGHQRITNAYLVIKAIASRVGSDDLEGKLTEDEADKRGWDERGTITKRRRLVGPIKHHYERLKRSILLNTPTDLVLTKLDWIFPETYGVTGWSQLPEDAQIFVENLENELEIPKYGKTPITYIRTGPCIGHRIDMRAEKGTI